MGEIKAAFVTESYRSSPVAPRTPAQRTEGGRASVGRDPERNPY